MLLPISLGGAQHLSEHPLALFEATRSQSLLSPPDPFRSTTEGTALLASSFTVTESALPSTLRTGSVLPLPLCKNLL